MLEPSGRSHTRIAVLALAFAVAAGCGLEPVDPQPTAAPASAVAVDLSDDRRFREGTGLRSDDAWILWVRNSPDLNFEFGVALTQAEWAEVQGRALVSDALAQRVGAYARARPEFGGLLIRPDLDGVVELRLTGRIEEHQAALAKLIHPDAMLDIIPVQNTYAELKALADRVQRDEDWLATVDAVVVASGVDIARNQAKIEVSSPNPEIARLISDRYGAKDRLYVVSDGTGVKLLPFGEVMLTVVDRRGRPVGGLRVGWESDLPGGGTDALGYITEADGTTLLIIRALGQTISVYEEGDDSRRALGSGHVVVRADERTALLIEVGE